MGLSLEFTACGPGQVFNIFMPFGASHLYMKWRKLKYRKLTFSVEKNSAMFDTATVYRLPREGHLF